MMVMVMTKVIREVGLERTLCSRSSIELNLREKKVLKEENRNQREENDRVLIFEDSQFETDSAEAKVSSD